MTQDQSNSHSDLLRSKKSSILLWMPVAFIMLWIGFGLYTNGLSWATLLNWIPYLGPLLLISTLRSSIEISADAITTINFWTNKIGQRVPKSIALNDIREISVHTERHKVIYTIYGNADQCIIFIPGYYDNGAALVNRLSKYATFTSV